MSERTTHHFAGMGLLSLALIICALIGAGAVKQVKRANDTITVTGSAKRAIRSDFAVWRGAVTSQDASLQEAFQQIKRYAERLHSFLQQNQIPDSLVTFYPIQTNSIQETSEKGRGYTGRVLAYQLRQNFEIRSADVDRIKDLSMRSSELIQEGIVLESHTPEFLCTGLPELRSDMLAEAAADAKRRAQSMAESVGSRIGAVRSARMGVFQITARHSTDVRDYGIYDTSALEKDITAVVSMTFTVK
ncbi:MAG: SIMPL domain-containing protein [bacterium]